VHKPGVALKTSSNSVQHSFNTRCKNEINHVHLFDVAEIPFNGKAISITQQQQMKTPKFRMGCLGATPSHPGKVLDPAQELAI
jgi:hypothetical protein